MRREQNAHDDVCNLNNITNNLAVSENMKLSPPAFTHAFTLLVQFLTVLQITWSACSSLATDFNFGEKSSTNTIRNY